MRIKISVAKNYGLMITERLLIMKRFIKGLLGGIIAISIYLTIFNCKFLTGFIV